MFGLDYASAVTLLILLAAVVLLASQKLRVDLVALLVLSSLILSGVLTPEQAFDAFGRPLIIIVVGIFVIGTALRETGVAKILSNHLLRWGGQSRTRLLLMVMGTAALLSAFLSGLLVVTILLPAVLRIGKKQEIPPSQILLPMAVAALMGNQLTLIGTTANIVVADLLSQNSDTSLGFFTLTPYAAASLLVAIGWFYLLGWRTLGETMPDEPGRPSLREVEADYGLEGSFQRLRVRSNSDLIGERLESSSLRRTFELTVVAIQGDDGRLHAASPDWVLERNCELVIEVAQGREAEMHQAAHRHGLEPLGDVHLDDFSFTEQPALHLTEAVVPYKSNLVGKPLANLDLRQEHGLQVLAVNRRGQSLQAALAELTLETGDILLIEGNADQVRTLTKNRDLILITDLSPNPGELITPKARIAIAIVGLALALVVANLLSLAVALLLASLALILTGCLSLDRAYAGINPTILIIIGGMLPLATALQQTGGADLIANAISSAGTHIGSLGTMVLLYTLLGLLTQVVPNSVVAAIFTPVAISLAKTQGVPPLQFAIPVIFAANASYISPLTSATNLLIQGKGEYSLRDFWVNTIPLFLLQGLVVLGLGILLTGGGTE